ncbi:MAG: hypothetical protein QGG24_06445 [Vicinamibacterales bacterium]|jgi:Na+-transporting NADH:ubiquinone oxidoreductase subunit NqrE|nr:hypothetical protein [Acidobacteriota bacterium]MDP7294942.1 hypothetical protein [Vicinamibacterales bacterium]MDP7473018.1 hypothetical protein [Vicinamibacterales bacterium]MDP7670358.1 hypothetical protein [Vicinamibacterales bacterium]HJO38015.1 hypothetical protein [Vicinamibacterales bacterium]
MTTLSPHDAVFLALAATLFVERAARWPWVTVVPLVAWLVALAPLGGFGLSTLALVVCLPSPRFAPVAFLLALPEYASVMDALVAGTTWLGATSLLDTLESRLSASTVPERLRGAPVRLLTVGVLYYVFQPVFYL